MPQMADLTVKKNDGTTNVVYSAVVPSAGDKTPAIWRSNTVGTSPAVRPEVRLSSFSNGAKTARRVEATVVYPSFVTGTDGKVTVTDRAIFSVSAVIPQGMLDTDIAEFASQAVNIMGTTLVKDSLKAGYAPT